MLRPADVPVALLVLAFCCAGCGRREDLPQVAPVSGSVTYNGKPVASGTVTFHPAGGGRPASGQLDADGRFELSTFDRGDGAVLGKHRVTVVAYDASTDPSIAPDSADVYAVPEKYTEPETTPLEVEVTEGGNTMDLELKD